jgi:FkbM family methyltransferase
MAQAIADAAALKMSSPEIAVGGPVDSREYVRWAYRLLLGREPERSTVMENHPFKNDRQRLVESVLRSNEFRRANPNISWPPNDPSLGVEFDVSKLRDRSKRWSNIAELRQSTKSIPVDKGLILCRMLGKYRQYVSAADIGLSPYVILDGFFEYAITEFVVRNVSAGMRVLDIGANYGYYTILMADLVADSGKVYAFEPNPVAANAISLSLMVNNYHSRVSIDRRALWDGSREQVTFHVPEAAATTARIVWPLDGRLPPSDPGTPAAGSTTVETVALDDLALDGIGFVKADIEGAEERLWHGGQKFFERNPQMIFLLEFNCRRCENAQKTLEQMSQIVSLRYLDDESRVKEIAVEQVLASPYDWMLVLSQKEEID